MGLEDEINEYNAAIAEEAREKERVAQEARREAIESARVAQEARREIAQRAAIKQAALDALAMEKLAVKKKKLMEVFKILDPVSFLQDVNQGGRVYRSSTRNAYRNGDRKRQFKSWQNPYLNSINEHQISDPLL